MKKQLLFTLCSFAFMLLAFTTQAQDSKVDANPTYQQFNDQCILDKVEYTQERTIFHFRYKASTYTSIWLYAPQGDHPWFLKDEINGEEYNLIGVYNVRRNNRLTHKEVTGNYAYMHADEKKEKTYFECEVHFERLPSHVTEVDLIEGKGMEQAWNHFHCFDIQVSPLKDKTTQDVVIIAPIQPENILIAPNVDLFQEAVAPIAPVAPTPIGNATETADVPAVDNGNASSLEINQNVDWSVFPTPATSVLNVKQSEAQQAQLTLVTLSGQTIWTGKMQGTTTTIDVSELVPGAYLLTHTVNAKTTSQKVLIK